MGINDPPKTIRIASINPAIGTPVCCIGIVVVTAFTVVVEFVGVIGFVEFVVLIVIGVTPSLFKL